MIVFLFTPVSSRIARTVVTPCASAASMVARTVGDGGVGSAVFSCGRGARPPLVAFAA